MSDRIAQLHKILQAEPDDSFCLYGMAMEHAKLGHHDDAIAWFDKTLAVDPHYCYAYFHKAKSQQELGDDEAARQTLRAGLEKARSIGDEKAAGEIAGFLDELS